MGFSFLDSVLTKIEKRNSMWSLSSRTIARYFHSQRQVLLPIAVPKIMLMRGQVLADDISEMIEEEEDYYIDVGNIMCLVYTDFLRYIKKGLSPKTVLNHLENLIQTYRYEEEIIFEQTSPFTLNRILKEKKVHGQAMIQVEVYFLKKDLLRGEVLLYELRELNSNFDLTIEQLISLFYQDFIVRHQGKSTESVTKTIIALLKAQGRID